jgi:hypothetical protein
MAIHRFISPLTSSSVSGIIPFSSLASDPLPLLVDYNLSDTDNGKLLLERVVQLFLSIDYGSRVSAVLRRDHDDSQLIPPFTGDERQL